MADIIQGPLIRHGLNSIEVDEYWNHPYLAKSLCKDVLHVESGGMPSLLETLQDTHDTLLAFPDGLSMAWRTPSFMPSQPSKHIPLDRSLKQVLQQARHMAEEGICISSYDLVLLLQRCINEHDLASGRHVHSIIQKCGLERDAFIVSHLIHMFRSFGCLSEATEAFTELPEPSIFSWCAIISAHVSIKNYDQAFLLYVEMLEKGVQPDGHVFVAILKACVGIEDLDRGYWIHRNIVKCGYETEVFVGSTLIHMYAKCGKLEVARQVFHKLSDRNVVTWSILIDGYTQHGNNDEALTLFEQMRAAGMEPNVITLASVLKACTHLEAGKKIHMHIVGHGLEADTFVSSTLLNTYIKCGSLMDAQIVLERLQKRDIVAWSALIAGYCHEGHCQVALQLYEIMQKEGTQPNAAIFSCALKACASLGALGLGMDIHSMVVEKEIEADVYVGSSLIDMYSKCGDIRAAQAVFQSLPERNVITWSAMISGLVQQGDKDEANQLLHQMKEEAIEPNEYTLVSILEACSDASDGRKIHVDLINSGYELDTHVGNALLDMYAKCNSLEDAYRLFNRLPERDVVSWTTLMAGSMAHEDGEVALQHYVAMQREGIKPTMATFLTSIKACTSIAALEHGRLLHAQVALHGYSLDWHACSALIEMYTGCGCLQDASMVFERLSKHDVGVYSAMITCCAQHSNYQMALQYFQAMLEAGIKADEVAFLCILSACGHAGLVQEGCSHFKAMREAHGLLPGIEHFNCIVNLLGNKNLLDEARDSLESLPFGANIVGWMSLLTSCKRHANVEIGRQCFDHIVTLEHGNSASYVLMSNLYSSSGMKEYGKRLDELRLIANNWKKPAKAFIEIDSEIHGFVVDDKCHPDSEAIYGKLRALTLQMKQEGHHAFLKPEEGEEEKLCGHSEKLALSLGLLRTARGTTIRISKKLRMCTTCHTDTAFISKAERREIIIADTCVVHHFQDGYCGCNMYNT